MEQNQQEARILEAEQKAKALLDQMTLTEKLGQLSQFGTSIYSDKEFYFEDHYPEGKVGSYLTIKGAKKTNRIQKEVMEQSRLSIPVIFADDVIHGFRTTFPTPLALSCSWEPSLAEEGSAVAAKEAYRAGLKWTFAPMVDIARDPRWGRIMEGYGEDTYLCCRFAEASVKGFQGDYIGQKDHLLACMKHYVAYGACIGGRDYNSADMALQTLHEVYLPSFKAGIDAGAATVMSAFHDFNGVPCSANKYLLRDVLRDEYGFDGIVISDAGSIHELVDHGYAEDGADAAGKGFASGVDIVMSGDLYNDHLPEHLEKGTVTMEMVDDAVFRILKLKYLLGLFEEPFVDESMETECHFCPEHLESTRNSARRSIVLLENRNKTLPIQPKKGLKIAVIGPLQDNKTDVLGGWAGFADPSHTVTLLDGIREAAAELSIEVVSARGCEIVGEDTSGFDEACRVAASADLILATVGENRDMSGEAYCRSELTLPGVQEQLIARLTALGKPVVALVSAGRPMVLSAWKDSVDSLVMMWQLGTETGHAVADVLFGKYNPAGRLTTSFPHSEGQLPVYYNYYSTGRPVRNIRRWEVKYMDAPADPTYCFGYGLSYTDFHYSDLSLSANEMSTDGSLEISCTVTNTGDWDGEEVVQLYVRDLVGCRVRPVKELKGFQKIFLAKGESRRVTFKLEAKELAFFDADMNKIVEPGKFQVWISKNCLANTLEGEFTVV